MNRLLLLPLLLAALLVAGCKQDKVAPKDQLPPATTTGANTWGCLVNGEVWKGSTSTQIRADWTVPEMLSAIMRAESGDGHNRIIFTFPDSLRSFRASTGPRRLSADSSGNHAWLKRRVGDLSFSNLITGSVTLTRVDYQAGVVSGTFSFVMSAAPGDTVRVTDGRFDISNMDR